MPKVTIVNDDKTFEVKAGTSLQDLCEQHDTSILFGCRSASCGTCLIKIIAGNENLSPMQDDERDFLESMGAEPQDRLGCQVKIFGDCKIEVVE